MNLAMLRHDLRREVERRPFGIGETIGGQCIPLEEGMTDAERIAALEDAVRGLHAGLMKLAGAVSEIRR